MANQQQKKKRINKINWFIQNGMLAINWHVPFAFGNWFYEQIRNGWKLQTGKVVGKCSLFYVCKSLVLGNMNAICILI